MNKNEIYYYFNFNFNSMARRYTRRYRRGRRYYRRRFPRKRFLRGVDRNTFCLVTTENINYTFAANDVIGYPSKFINFGIQKIKFGEVLNEVAIGAPSIEKFDTLAKIYDQVRLKGMSVKMSYVAATGLSAQTLNLVTMVDRCTFGSEISNNYNFTKASDTTRGVYRNKVNNAASRRKTSLTGGKTVYFYYFPLTLQEKTFINIDQDYYIDNTDLEKLSAMDSDTFNGFNPCIYSYIEKSAAAESSQTSVVVNVEVKYYVEFKSSC